ncbi:hypothetical protein CGRA01v4_11555 [Colletotrichum graminicola]|nr:hypothetical protein CGRA01v4_11555 [Colletotrichum graminicola]
MQDRLVYSLYASSVFFAAQSPPGPNRPNQPIAPRTRAHAHPCHLGLCSGARCATTNRRPSLAKCKREEEIRFPRVWGPDLASESLRPLCLFSQQPLPLTPPTPFGHKGASPYERYILWERERHELHTFGWAGGWRCSNGYPTLQM